MIEYRVTAVDEFDRVFHSYFMTASMFELDQVAPGWLFRRAVGDILKQMGEAAWAEWTAEMRPW